MPNTKKTSSTSEPAIALPKVEIFIKEPIENTKTLEEKKSKENKGLKFEYTFSNQQIHPFDELEWENKPSIISDEKGNIISGQEEVEAPTDWSQLATDIMVSKYFRKAGLPDNKGETSAKQVISRVALTIRQAGEKSNNYFSSTTDADAFERDLTWLLINQAAAFNSPVWFNCGLYQVYGIEGTKDVLYRWNPTTKQAELQKTSYEHPQCSACFIQSIEDDLMSIFELIKDEAKLFKFGSGTGTNFSPLRSSNESLSGGGTSSGLMSFLQVFDRGAGATKSGGITRRAAKMVILNADHPEIFEFVKWKAKEEEKARILIEYGGLPSDFNGEAYHTVSGQNSNNSVRVTDDFMKAVENDEDWHTIERTTGKITNTFKARSLMKEIVHSAWVCADPGLQFDTVINKWHTCKTSGRINASNPCSEYMFLDDSACNLASINLLKFLKEDGSFDIKKYHAAIRILITAMEIIVEFSSYPTAKIAENSYKFRPLGLGYANLGTLLMIWGIPYDSEEGRVVAGALTAILTGQAYKTSAEVAGEIGTFGEYKKNHDSFMEVMNMHRAASYDIPDEYGHSDLITVARQDWNEVVKLGEKNGFRNAQTTVLAPTGTIGLLMDCDTTGVEPAFSLVTFKKLAGGGSVKIINHSVPNTLTKLNYFEDQIKEILEYIIGAGKLLEKSPINETSLREKGITQEDIDKINKALPGAFNIAFAFNKATISEQTLKNLQITSEEMNTPGFNFLKKIGFSNDEIIEANKIICGHMMIEGAPHIKEEDLAVFDCANTNGPEGKRYIEPLGHVKMLAAIQPFISGAISKTVNMPNSCTEEEIQDIYMQSWKLGVKAIAMYRDGSKGSQPLSSKTKETKETTIKTETKIVYMPTRKRLPDERRSITHKFTIGNHEGYITAGLYENGQPGEIFITMSKQGSVISGLVNSFATAISISLQYGVPLKVLVNKFIHSRFEPSGFTHNPQIQIAKSIVDYIFRWLALKFLSAEELQVIGINGDIAPSPEQKTLNLATDAAVPTITKAEDLEEEAMAEATINTESPPSSSTGEAKNFFDTFSDAPACDNCGGIMTRSGTCYKCMNCGSTTGCS